MAILRLLASLFIFVGILVGCVAALLLIAMLLACWIFSQLLQTANESPN